MVEHIMSAADAAAIVRALVSAGVDPCVGGGWAVDALLGAETRPHSDLDLWIGATELEALIVVFGEAGLDRLLPWGNDKPWNFVLHDGGVRRVDLHLYERVPDGLLHYGSVITGETFPATALAGHGTIAGLAVRCETPEWSLRCHTGYAPRPVDRHDVSGLCRAYGLDPPPGFGAPAPS